MLHTFTYVMKFKKAREQAGAEAEAVVYSKLF